MCRSHLLSLLCLAFLVTVAGCTGTNPPNPPNLPDLRPGATMDEALRAGRAAASFPAADEDYFHDMDGGGNLTKSQIVGRNNWIVWTGGNDHLWDDLTLKSVGNFDLLKTISSYPYPKGSKLPDFGRHNRWWYLGLVNEPCFQEAKAPNKDRWGLWIDTRQADCPADPFENEA